MFSFSLSASGVRLCCSLVPALQEAKARTLLAKSLRLYLELFDWDQRRLAKELGRTEAWASVLLKDGGSTGTTLKRIDEVCSKLNLPPYVLFRPDILEAAIEEKNSSGALTEPVTRSSDKVPLTQQAGTNVETDDAQARLLVLTQRNRQLATHVEELKKDLDASTHILESIIKLASDEVRGRARAATSDKTKTRRRN
jgi:ribosomal protein S15P/S13E